MANAESARSSAYSANAAAQQMRRRIETLESDLRDISRALNNFAESASSRFAGLESEIHGLRELVAQLQEKLA